MRGGAWIPTGWTICCDNCGSRTDRLWRSSPARVRRRSARSIPLPAIADVCQRYGVWLHVDAAHGGSACVSPRYRHLVDGLDRADSVVWDAHKMLFMPALCAFVFFRDKAHRFEAFRQEAPYSVRSLGSRTGRVRQRTADRGMHQAGGGVWAVGRLGHVWPAVVHRPGRCHVSSSGQTFYEKLQAAPDFEPVHEPQCNIVVFRYVPNELIEAPPEQLGRFQLELRRRVIESGEFYIVSTKIDGVGAMRTTIINPLTTPDHLDQLLDTIRRHGRDLLASPHTTS